MAATARGCPVTAPLCVRARGGRTHDNRQALCQEEAHSRQTSTIPLLRLGVVCQSGAESFTPDPRHGALLGDTEGGGCLRDPKPPSIVLHSHPPCRTGVCVPTTWWGGCPTGWGRLSQAPGSGGGGGGTGGQGYVPHPSQPQLWLCYPIAT